MARDPFVTVELQEEGVARTGATVPKESLRAAVMRAINQGPPTILRMSLADYLATGLQIGDRVPLCIEKLEGSRVFKEGETGETGDTQ